MNAHPSRCRCIVGCTIVALCLLLVAASPAWAGKVKPAPVYTPYFGELHAHSMYSDGTGTPVGAYASGRAAGLDFFTLTDHNMMLAPWQWDAVAAAADAADDPGAFVAMPGYELGWWYDHLNIFNPPYLTRQPDVPQDAKATADDFEAVAASLPGAVAQFNHPTWSGGDDFEDFAYRSPERDAVLNLIEIYNHGDGEAEWYEPSYVKCLDAGWHVMPTATGDTHYVDWDVEVMPYQMRTALLASSLTREALYEAMRAHRGYATLDRNLRVSFKVNGAVMGSIVTPSARYTVSVSVTDPDSLAVGDKVTKLDLVSDGGAVVAAKKVSGHSVTWAPSVTSSTARYFYLRVTTADGPTAWTAPVWTGR